MEWLGADLKLNLQGGPKVNKIAAAIKQSNMAVRLLFEGDQDVAAHTLAMASSQILRDCCMAADIKSEFESLIAPNIDDEQSFEDIRVSIHAPANFLKHARSDPHGVIELPQPELIDILLYHVSQDIEALGYEQSTELNTISIWCAVRYVLMKNREHLKLTATEFEMLSSFSRGDWLALGGTFLYMQLNEIDLLTKFVDRIESSQDIEASRLVRLLTRMI